MMKSSIDGALMDNGILKRKFEITVIINKKNELACGLECPFLSGDVFCKLFHKQLMQSVHKDFTYRYLECSNMTSHVVDLIKQDQKQKKIKK